MLAHSVFLRLVRRRVIGFETDIEQAVQLLDSLWLQGEGAMQAWAKARRGASFSERRSHRFAFAVGAAGKITETRRQVMTKVREESGTGSELVLIKRDDAVQNEFTRLYPRTATSSLAPSRSRAAEVAGYRAGKQSMTGQTEVGARQAIGA